MRRIAFVGAQQSRWDRAGVDLDSLKMNIHYVMNRYLDDSGPYIFVSGACPKGGVDIIAEEVADELGLEKEIYPPDILAWTGSGQKWGYKERNLIIAAVSDIVINIDPPGVKSGGEWTRLAAKKLGRVTHRMEYHSHGLQDWTD